MEQAKEYYYKNRKPFKKLFLLFFVFIVILGVVFSLRKTKITVTGSSENVRVNEVARFMIHVSATNDDKETAINEMSENTQVAIDSVKEFGIPTDDIKTVNLNVYQEQIWDEFTRKSEPGEWVASNSVEVKLADIENIDEFTDLITSLDATSVNGPNFALDDTLTDEGALLNAAIEDARTKADAVAKAAGKRIVKVESIVEHSGPVPMPMFRAEGLGGGAGIPIEPGTSAVSKTVTVTFVAK